MNAVPPQPSRGVGPLLTSEPLSCTKQITPRLLSAAISMKTPLLLPAELQARRVRGRNQRSNEFVFKSSHY